MVVTRKSNHRDPPIRASKEFKKLLLETKAAYMLRGIQPPSYTELTRMVAKKIKKEDLYKDEFIKFE